MALLNPTFIFGVIVLLYLSSFILFAIIRIVTGISIQRIGYFSLRRLAFTPKDGIKIEIRGLGLNIHRPTFAEPTWLSVVLTELAVTLDLKVLDGEKKARRPDGNGVVEEEQDGSSRKGEPDSKPLPTDATSFEPQRSKMWEQLTSIKERIKRLHRNINWIQMVDIVASNSSVTVVDVGNIQLGSFTMGVDTRRKTVDRGMFTHVKNANSNQQPAEWMLTIRSVLFTPEGGQSLEILDHLTLNISGILYKELDGLREAAIALKLGRVHIPYDDINACIDKYKGCRKLPKIKDGKPAPEEISVASIIGELERPGSEEKNLVQTVSDSKEFASSILRGIIEVQFAVSYIGFTKKITSVQPSGSPMYLNASMKEVGVDLHRLDQKSPAHRMYFSSKDIAHQALIAALSISVGVDDGRGRSDRLVYVPMATTTIRTTFLSKTVQFAIDNTLDERNANILFANAVVTSPSIDLDPRHLPLVLAMAKSNPKSKSKEDTPERHTLMSRLLPKANVKFSMHEPVIRISLPPVEDTAAEDDFDLIISSISSISLDIESSHSAVGELHYSLGSTLRLQSHDLYYQTCSGSRFDLLQIEALDLKVSVSANPEVYVVATGNVQTFSVHMIRPEISDGVRQIVRQLRLNVEPDKKPHSKTSRDPNFIRALPPWLLHFQLQGSDFSAEVAGIDESIAEDTRGVAIQLESWTAEYRAQKVEPNERRTRRRAGSRSLTPDPEIFLTMPPSPRRKRDQNPTDGRRLAIHGRGLESFVVESTEKWEVEPFVSIPKFEVALSTLSDNQGPIFHLNSHVKSVLVQYSLYRHYACGVASSVLRKAFVRTYADVAEAEEAARATASLRKSDPSALLSPVTSPGGFSWPGQDDQEFNFGTRELVTIDFRSTLIQVKAHLPSDPKLMLQIYGVDAGRHRWSAPFLHAKLVRLYAEAPQMKRVWARIVSIRSARVDFREKRQMRSSGEMHEEKTIDITTNAIRLAVPHQLIFHQVIDNVVNTLKAVEQLHHRIKTGTNEYILDKHPEGPKLIPRLSVRSKALLFELEDGAFEWKLGAIYRAGLIEQQQRLAREAAFDVKAKKIEEEEMRRDTQRYRNRSAHPRGRSNNKEDSSRRHKSVGDDLPEERSPRTERGRKYRYDPEGTSGISGTANISISEAHDRLRRHNAQSWKRRIDRVYAIAKDGMKNLRGVFWGPDELPDDMEEIENILEVPQRPALMSTLISDLHITVDKPSFPMNELPDFLHKMGKGMPRDMQYSLLVPMNVQIDMGEARVTLRDYPLPLLHVPAIRPGQSPRMPAWSLKTDFVIAEEFRGPESIRHIKVDIIPPLNREPGMPKTGGFAIDVRKTVTPVKCYSNINVNINTELPTRITWGASYQPAIQDMMMVIETFTKPQVDPSERIGFWDKLRLSFHSKIDIAWKGDGDVHLTLKGTRDPYIVTGDGAGFLMCWRSDVRLSVCRDDDPRKFITVDSGEYILAIPDFSHQARVTASEHNDSDSVVSSDSFRHGAIFKKVVMKLSGNVQWLVGLMFERDLDDGTRSFDFEPHYNVVTKELQYCKPSAGQEYDAFRGFRSQHIHMSIAVKAPVDREWSVSNTEPSRSYNTVHLTPRFFTHFFSWWSMFGGTMSLPIRQGDLWPGIEKSSKKFGRHLATIKYNLLLAPLFLSHVYKHKDAEDYSEDVVSATGLKMRLDSFMLDMHQRREEFMTQDKGRNTQTTTTSMKLHRAQLDLLSADIRAISASIAGTTPEDLQKASAPTLVSQLERGQTDLSHFDIPDNDFTWIDMDDFVELDWILPAEANPEMKILPLAYAPRFTYFRQTDHGDNISGDPERTSPFGNEPTHFCIMSKDDDPRRVQCQLITDRLVQLDKQIDDHQEALESAEWAYSQDPQNTSLKAQYDQLTIHGPFLHNKKIFLESMKERMVERVNTNDPRTIPDGDEDADRLGGSPIETEAIHDDPPSGDFVSDFNNRFVIHNMQLKWNNVLRNIILRYIHQVSQRRGFVYYLSRRAVKFILDIVEEQNKAKNARPTAAQTGEPSMTSASAAQTPEDLIEGPESQEVEDRIKEILADGKKFVNADDPQVLETAHQVSPDQLNSNITPEFTPQNSYHVRLIAPQIQLQSEKNLKSVVMVTAKGMELKVVEVMDKHRMFDDVSGLVQRRFSVEMDSTQFFVTHQKWFSAQVLSLYSGSHYGASAGSSWPPWVPMEVMFDFQVDPFGFKRVVQKTSASLRYEKYNTLRLKYNDEISNENDHPSGPNDMENRMDNLWVEFPKIQAICNSSQYYAMYIIVLDLLMYSEPLEKTRNERLEKIMLASDFSDLRGAPEMVTRLQERIRQLDEIKTQFQIHSKSLDKKGWEDRITLDRDLAACEDELFFMMKAITTSQRKYDGTQASGLLRWNISSDQIVWHLIRDNNEPLMEFQIQHAEYDRTDNSDGSHINLMQIGNIVGLNLMPDAIYPEMFAPYFDVERGAFNEGGNQQMLRVYWYMLEAIAGIPVMDHFEVNLFPMKIQLEREVGKRLFEYMFPGHNDDKPNANKTKSPFMVKNMIPVDDEEDGNDTTGNNSINLQVTDVDNGDPTSSTRPGSLELRLHPTMTSEYRPTTASSTKSKASSMLSGYSGDSHHFRLFQSNKSSTASRGSSTKTAVSKKPSLESLQSGQSLKPTVTRTSTNASANEQGSTNGDQKGKRFGIRGAGKTRKDKPSDDLTKMMSRASEYMTLAYVKIPSVVLCLSYKGKGERNIEDVHDFVFRLPMIEYRNKTWSNLDLALALKKDVIRALISHTGAIIGNKFSKHRPNIAQQSRLRELATSSVVLSQPPSTADEAYETSDTSSIFATSPTETRHSDRSASRQTDRSKSGERRKSFASSRNGIEGPASGSSSVYSGVSQASRPPYQASFTMTPASREYDDDTRSLRPFSRSGGVDGNTIERPHSSAGAFMASTFHRLKKNPLQHRDAISSSPSLIEGHENGNADGRETNEDANVDTVDEAPKGGRKKAKSLLGRSQ